MSRSLSSAGALAIRCLAAIAAGVLAAVAPARGQTAACPSGAAQVDASGSFVALGAREGVVARGGASGSAEHEFALGADTASGSESVRAQHTWVSARPYPYTFALAPDGTGRLSVYNGLTRVVDLSYRHVARPMGLGNALQFRVGADAGLGTGKRIRLTVLSINGSVVNATLQTSGTNAASEQQIVYASTSLASGVLVTGTVTSTFTGSAPPVGSALRASIAAGNVTCQGEPAPRITRVVPELLSMQAGAATSITVVLDRASSSDTLIRLTSTDSSIAGVPSQVTVPAGSRQATAVVTAGTTAGRAGIAADVNGSAAAIQVTVSSTPAQMARIEPPEVAVAAGAGAQAQAKLDRVPAQPTEVEVTVAPASLASVPATVTVAPGQTSAPIGVTGNQAGSGQISATTGGTAAQANVLVSEALPTVGELKPAALSLVTGASSRLTVTLSAAQATDVTVPLSNSAPAVVSVPASVVIAAGRTSQSVDVSALAPGAARVQAELNGPVRFADVTVVPSASVASGAPNPLALQTGAAAPLEIKLNAVAAVDTPITLSSGNLLVAAVLPRAQVPAGEDSVRVMVAGVSPGTTDIYASAGGGGAVVQVAVLSGAPALAPFAPAALDLAKGKGGVMRVRLNRAGTSPVTVALASSAPAVASVVSGVTIAAGETYADVPIGALAEGAATISATLGSSVQPLGVQVGAAVVVGVSSSKSTLTVAAGSGDSTSLRAHYSDGTQQDVTAQASWSTSNVSIATVSQGNISGVAPGAATITGAYPANGTPYTAGTAVTVIETAQPLNLAGSTTIALGGSAVFTVSRASAAPRDILVTLTRSGAVFDAPASVLIPTGQTSAGFSVSAVALGSGSLVASADNHVAAAATITVVALGPDVTAIDPASGPVETLITITGSNFAPNRVENTVTFAGANASRVAGTVLSANATQLSVRVPVGAVTGTVNVQTALGTAAGPVFTVVAEQDVGLAASPVAVNVYQGASSMVSLNLSSLGNRDYNGLMQLSVAGLPAGVTAAFNPTHLARGQSGTLLLSAAAGAAPIADQDVTITAANVSGGFVGSRTALVRVSVLAAGGVTGVRGRFVTPEGAPIAGVRVAVQDAGGNVAAQTQSDAAGGFVLTGLAAGNVTLRLDATPANPLYPIWPYSFNHPGNTIVQLPDWTINPPPADDKFTPINNAVTDQIVTDPRLPGVEITLPAGVTITGYDGVVKSRIAVEKLTPDKLPTTPPPIRTESIYQLYFGTPMGGIPSAPIPVKVPNDLGLEPGETTELWYFDGMPTGGSGEWRVAGIGTVSADGKFIVSEPGQGVPRFCGVCGLFCFADNQDRSPNPPCDDCEPGAPPQGAGNPITLATGQELESATDLVLDGDPSIVISRRFNPFDAFGYVANYTQSLGVNWTLNYDVALMPFNDGAGDIRLVMPGNRRFSFAHTGGGEYRATTGPLMMQGHKFRRVGGTSPTSTGQPIALQVLPAAGSATAGVSALAPADVNNCFFSTTATNYQLEQKNGEVWTFSPFPAATSVRIRGGCLYFLTEIRDGRGRTLTIQRGSNGALSRITSSSGRWVQFTYGSGGVIAGITDSLGRSVTYTHERLPVAGTASGFGGFGGLRLSSTASGSGGGSAGAAISIRDDLRAQIHRLTSASTPDGTYTYGYEDDPPDFRLGGARFSAASTGGNSGGGAASFVAIGNVGTGTVDACPMMLGGARINRIARPDLPGEIVNTYGPSHRVHRQSWPDGTRLDFGYRIVGACVYNTASPTQRCTDATCPTEDNAATAAAGWRFVGGRVLATTVSDAGGLLYTQRFNNNRVAVEYIDALGQSWKYERDANNRITRTSDPLGRVTRYTNDENGNQTRIIDAANRVTEVSYTLTGITKPTSIRRFRGDGTSIFWQLGFDAATGNLSSVRDPNNNTISMTYAGTNKLLQTLRSAAGRTTRFEHNNRGEAIKITDAASRDVLLDWDDAGRLSRLTDPLGNATAFAYNGRHQLTTVTGADGGMTRLGYDGSNRLQSVTDPLNQTLERYAYTAASRLSSRTDAFDRSVGYTYDERGRLIEMLDRRGQRLVLSYDAVGRITAIGRPDGTTNYRYDAVGRLIEIADGAGRIAIDYDSVDRPAKETHVQGDTIVTVEHVWDELDRRTQRRVSAVGPGGSLPVQTTDYTYDEGGRITRVTQNGLASTYTWDQDSRLTARTLPNGIAVAYSYDEVNQLTDITYRRTDGSLIERVSYQYDAAGRRIQKDTLVSPRVDETPIAATYDAGNRLTAVTLNPGGASPATYNLAYDGNGNLVERRNAADATDVTTYTWDSRNRLSAISAPGLSAAFVYDSLGRRIERTVTRAGEPAIVTRYVYDGLQAVGELRPQQGPVTEQTTALVTGTGLDEVLARVASGPNGVSPQTRVYVTDALSSALLLAREDQSIETTYGYSPYGQAFAGGADGSNSVQYTARENDRTGLLFFRARYYDPVLKRFVSEDPIGLAAGTNAYAYVEGDPLGYSDPLGLFSAADLPSVPQWLVDGAAGFGDTLSFGLTDWVRDQMGTNGVVDKCSGAYSAGEWAGIGVSVATGVAGGIRAAGARGAGREFSHWIPNRMGGPRSIWNGNYVSTEVHALSDPYRYRFMPRDWKAANPMPSRANQQWVRIPNAYKGAGAGGAYGAGGAAMNNCTCP